MRKKMISIAAVLTLLAFLFSGCGKALPQRKDKLNVVCTVFPLYDWTCETALGNADVTLLLKNCTDMHSYQPTAADMVKIISSDVIIYIGGESDKWVEDALKRSPDKNRTEIKLMDFLGGRAIAEENEKHRHEETEYDEHVWLSVKNAILFTNVIADSLAEKDTDNADSYRFSGAEYVKRLNSLDNEYAELFNSVKKKSAVFADRFPFSYLFYDYGISCYAAFSGCSAETGAGFETVTFLAEKTDELKLKYIFTTESPIEGVAKTVIENTKNKNQEVLILDSMQSVTDKQIKNGITYISVADKNLKQLKKAFGSDF